jgi:hypothetical protein
VRSDLADVRLASQVFAPHYASPLAMRAIAATPILAAATSGAEILATLQAEDVFDVLEVTSSYCWGQARSSGLVGYVACDTLERTPATEEKAA